MNLLFEIPDKVLAIAGLIFVLLIIIVALIIKHSGHKVKPISEDDRYDSDDIKFAEVTKKELTNEQKEAKEELARVFNQMSEDLEKQKPTPEEIDDFEREQEENAIISYQELIAQAEKLKEKADKYEKIAIEKADKKVSTYDREDTIKELHDDIEKSKKKRQTFRNSDIISPIYGVQSNKNMVRQKRSPKKENHDIISEAYEEDLFELEKTQNLDFLNSLKQFRKNL